MRIGRVDLRRMAEDKLEPFLEKVDEIQSIIKALSSGDDETAADAMQKADDFLEKHAPDKSKGKSGNTGVNRTVINQKAFQDDDFAAGPDVNSDTNQDAFLSALEADAEDRQKRKQQARLEATAIKDKGNKEFKEGNYEKAVEYYTQALRKVKDMTTLWTNRAQAYIKLREYEKALKDCDWATRVDENCVKAYVHQGLAYLGLRRYNDAITSYEKAIQYDPKKESSIQEYILEVERTRISHEQV